MEAQTHSAKMKDGRIVTIREMTVNEVGELLKQASKGATDLTNVWDVKMREKDLRRKACLLAFGPHKVSRDFTTSDLVATLSARECDFVDALITRVHDANQDEIADFLATCQADQPRRLTVTAD